MARILSENGHSLPGIYEFMVEETSEIENLEISEYVRPGSKLYCLEDSKTYMLNNSGEWVEVNFKKGGGAGSVVVEALSVTENGTYTAEEGYAYSPVSVNVSGGGDEVLSALIDRSITSITIPSGVTKIGAHAFVACANLRTVNIPSTVTEIGNYAFDGCNGIRYINSAVEYYCNIPEGVTTIKDAAFNGATNMRNIVLPSTLASIGAMGLSILSLYTLQCNAVTPPTLGANNANKWSNLSAIYVPAESVDAYKAANNWKDKASIIQAIPSA